MKQLQRDRVNKTYRAALDNAYDKFVVWLSLRCLPFPDDCSEDLQRLNSLLVDYIQHLFTISGRDKRGLKLAALSIL